MKEVAGGTEADLQPVKPSKCRRCGREEEISYLYAHGGLCKRKTNSELPELRRKSETGAWHI